MVKTGLQAMHLLPEDEGEGGEEGGAEDEGGEEQPALLRVRNRLHLLRHQVIGGRVSHMMSRDFFPVAATPQLPLTSTLSTKPTPKVLTKFLLSFHFCIIYSCSRPEGLQRDQSFIK